MNVCVCAATNDRKWPRPFGNSIFAAEGEVAGRVDHVRYVELAPIEHCERKKPLRALASGHPHRLHHPDNPKYIHDTLEVVRQYLKTHFGAHPAERPATPVHGPIFSVKSSRSSSVFRRIL